MAVNGIDFGVTEAGFIPRSYEDVVAEMQDEVRGFAGESIPLSERTIEGQTIRIVAERVSELWEAEQALDAADDPDSASGADLDATCALTGTIREGERPSMTTLTLTGTPATIVSAGSQAETLSTAVVFETTDDATIAALAAWTITTGYAVDDRATNGGNAYVCITAGTSAGAGGPTTTSDDITDGTVHWRFMGAGTGAVDADAEAVVDGPQVAASGDVTVIDTPVGGWSGVINLRDADLGADEETDESLRVRRELEIGRQGSSPPDAIRAEMLDVGDGTSNPVTSCTVFYNSTDLVDADGMPPHSVEVLVRGGEDQDVVDALYDAVAAGIATTGTSVGTATDDEGVDHLVYYSRPEEILIYVDIEVEVDASKFQSGAEDLVKEAIVEFGDGRDTGVDVRASAVSAQAFAVAGVIGVAHCYIDDAPAPAGSATISISRRQLAVFDTSRISVTVTPVTP